MVTSATTNLIYLYVVLVIALLSILANIVGCFIQWKLKRQGKLAVSHRGNEFDLEAQKESDNNKLASQECDIAVMEQVH